MSVGCRRRDVRRRSEEDLVVHLEKVNEVLRARNVPTIHHAVATSKQGRQQTMGKQKLDDDTNTQRCAHGVPQCVQLVQPLEREVRGGEWGCAHLETLCQVAHALWGDAGVGHELWQFDKQAKKMLGPVSGRWRGG
jgi:hypothetical protein